MNCRELRLLLEPYSDGELDLVRRVEIEEHLAGCDECIEQEKRLRALRDVVSSPSLYHRAPAALRTRIQPATPPPAGRRRWSLWQLAAVAAAIALLIGTSATVGMLLSRPAVSDDDRLAELVVAGHVRSLQVDHLKDVASTDRHTVKPWLVEKLDFSPQVPDLSEQGYILSGARLDYLTDRPVAALVYKRRLHVINVFTWRGADGEDRPVREFARQGFNVRSWQRAGMTYWVVSDLNGHELDEFVDLFEEQLPALRP
jgi:anti-sigma factor RsiW